MAKQNPNPLIREKLKPGVVFTRWYDGMLNMDSRKCFAARDGEYVLESLFGNPPIFLNPSKIIDDGAIVYTVIPNVPCSFSSFLKFSDFCVQTEPPGESEVQS